MKTTNRVHRNGGKKVLVPQGTNTTDKPSEKVSSPWALVPREGLQELIVQGLRNPAAESIFSKFFENVPRENIEYLVGVLVKANLPKPAAMPTYEKLRELGDAKDQSAALMVLMIDCIEGLQGSEWNEDHASQMINGLVNLQNATSDKLNAAVAAIDP